MVNRKILLIKIYSIFGIFGIFGVLAQKPKVLQYVRLTLSKTRRYARYYAHTVRKLETERCKEQERNRNRKKLLSVDKSYTYGKNLRK